MRSLAIAVAVVIGACGGPSRPRAIDVKTVPTNEQDTSVTPTTTVAVAQAWREGPGGFPLPSDADAGTQMMGDDITFSIPRSRDDVHTALIAKLSADGYVLDHEKVALGGYRMTVHRGEQRYLVSVTENDASTLMTVTVK